jgi:hypothetical protein
LGFFFENEIGCFYKQNVCWSACSAYLKNLFFLVVVVEDRFRSITCLPSTLKQFCQCFIHNKWNKVQMLRLLNCLIQFENGPPYMVE